MTKSFIKDQEANKLQSIEILESWYQSIKSNLIYDRLLGQYILKNKGDEPCSVFVGPIPIVIVTVFVVSSHTMASRASPACRSPLSAADLRLCLTRSKSRFKRAFSDGEPM